MGKKLGSAAFGEAYLGKFHSLRAIPNWIRFLSDLIN